MSDIHVLRIKTKLAQEFDSLIDLSDSDHLSEDKRQQQFLTRAQAALVLRYSTEISKELAASSITDGYNDQGIDAIYFDRDSDIFYVVQSKWVQNGQKSPSEDEVIKVVNGFKSLVAGNLTKFNSKFARHKTEIDEALRSTDVMFNLILAYTGTQPISQHVQQCLDDLLDEYNDSTDIVSYRIFSQREIYGAVSGDSTSINSCYAEVA